MRRLLLLLLVAVALGAGYAWWEQWRAREPEEPGLTVEVEVVDEAGHPVTRADAQPRYRPGWRTVDSEGCVLLHGVVLRAEDAVTPEAVAGAIDVRSPTHAPRRGRGPEVDLLPDGDWHARFVLAGFGTVRLRVADTTLRGVRAWVVADPKAGRIEAPRGVAVARPGQPAEWRIFDGVKKVEVRIEGATGVAARSFVLDAPTEGYVREFGLEAEQAQPIRGRVAPPADGEAPPTLEGHVDVVELTDDGREVAFPRVRIADDGTFQVSYAGAGRYELTPVLHYARVPPKRVRGGDEVEVTGTVALPWLVLEGLEVDPDAPAPAANVTRLAEGGGEEHVSVWAFHAPERGWTLSLPGPGRYRVALTRSGTNDQPPAAGSAEADVEGTGPHELAFHLKPVPAGTIEVRVTAAGKDGGADVQVEADGERHATVLPSLGDTARIPNVRAGPFTGRVRFTAKDAAVVFLAGEVRAGESTTVEAAAVPGGTLVGRGKGARLAEDTRDRRIAFKAGGSPYGAAPGEVTLVREAGTERWLCSWPLAPGRYAATIAPWPREGPGESASLVFEVKAGQATEIAFDVP